MSLDALNALGWGSFQSEPEEPKGCRYSVRFHIQMSEERWPKVKMEVGHVPCGEEGHWNDLRERIPPQAH